MSAALSWKHDVSCRVACSVQYQIKILLLSSLHYLNVDCLLGHLLYRLIQASTTMVKATIASKTLHHAKLQRVVAAKVIRFPGPGCTVSFLACLPRRVAPRPLSLVLVFRCLIFASLCRAKSFTRHRHQLLTARPSRYAPHSCNFIPLPLCDLLGLGICRQATCMHALTSFPCCCRSHS